MLPKMQQAWACSRRIDMEVGRSVFISYIDTSRGRGYLVSYKGARMQFLESKVSLEQRLHQAEAMLGGPQESACGWRRLDQVL